MDRNRHFVYEPNAIARNDRISISFHDHKNRISPIDRDRVQYESRLQVRISWKFLGGVQDTRSGQKVT